MKKYNLIIDSYISANIMYDNEHMTDNNYVFF